MDSSRRSFDRSREPGPKKPRLAEETLASSNGQRPTASVASSGSVLSRLRTNNPERLARDTDGSPSELVQQYRTALSELTFNSKPIITNLTIIAGENLHAAKAIAATICANILEVPSEQKLPSLYLLDSIVKNIGRDYIKYFASRLSEVFCKAYQQVEPSIHPAMRHLFGTWKGVFPPQVLQMIEKELGLSAVINGSSSGTTTPRPDSQSQRPAHSIHVNPKYLEARQRFQQTGRVKGASDVVTGTLVSSPDDVEQLDKPSSLSSGRSWPDPTAQMHHSYRDTGSEPVREKNVSVGYREYDRGSNILRHSSLGATRTNEVVPDQGFEKPLYGAPSRIAEMRNQWNGLDAKFPNYSTSKPAVSEEHMPSSHSYPSRSSNVMSKSWKNSEEEEYVWDDLNSRSTDHSAANSLKKDWLFNNSERLVERESSNDMLSKERYSSDWRSHSGANRIAPSQSGRSSFNPLIGPGQQLSASASPSKQSPMHQRSPSPSFSGHRSGQLLHGLGEQDFVQNDILSRVNSRSSQFHGQLNVESLNRLAQDSPSISLQNVHLANLQKLKIHSSSPMVTSESSQRIPSLQPLQQDTSFSEPSIQSLKIQSDVLAIENPSNKRSSSVEDANHFSAEISGQSSTSRLLATLIKSGIHTSVASSATRPGFPDAGPMPFQVSVQSTPLSDRAPTQLTYSGSKVASPSLSSSPSRDSSSVPAAVSQRKVERPPLPPGNLPPSITGSASSQTSSVENNASNPVSTLISSLLAKGLISSSKSELPPSVPPEKPIPPQGKSSVIVSTSSTPASLVPISSIIPHLPSLDSQPVSQPDVQSSDNTSESSVAEILIGTEFKPDVIRKLHPAVISELFDNFQHQCKLCGHPLKFEERLNRHLEWHALRNPEQNRLNKASRSWYANSEEWVCKETRIDSAHESNRLLEDSGNALDTGEPMVPADESQCICFLCGELFEDWYSVERDEWMFKGAVYMNAAATDDGMSSSNDAFDGPIVHANCVSESFVCDL